MADEEAGADSRALAVKVQNRQSALLSEPLSLCSELSRLKVMSHPPDCSTKGRWSEDGSEVGGSGLKVSADVGAIVPCTSLRVGSDEDEKRRRRSKSKRRRGSRRFVTVARPQGARLHRVR